MNSKDLPPSVQFMFIALTKSAILVKELGKDKDFFVALAEEIWNSMEMTDSNELKDIIDVKMFED